MSIDSKIYWRYNMAEFDYQWKEIPSPYILYNEDRVKELLKYTQIKQSYFKGKKCLDAGCGNGRYTYALQQLGAEVTSFDISEEAIEICKKINSKAYVFDIYNLRTNPIYDFVLCWGVLHHLPTPRKGFQKISSQLKQKGILHIMVYHKDTQKVYEVGRKIWSTLNPDKKVELCQKMIKKYGGNLHGWWDAFNPEFNWSYEPNEIKKWFKEEGFEKIKLTQKYNINMRGQKR